MTLLLALLLFYGGGGLEEKAMESINLVFGEDTEKVFETLELPGEMKASIEKRCGQRFHSDKLYLWKIYYDGYFNGVAIVDNVYGKVQPITFLVIFDTDGKVVDTTVLKYREPHGGEVQDPAWLHQFTGASAITKLRYGDDVQGITGATISSKSMTRGVKKLTLLVHEYMPEWKMENTLAK